MLKVISDIIPLPKCTLENKKRRRSQKSEIMSSSPFKNKFLNKQENRKKQQRREKVCSLDGIKKNKINKTLFPSKCSSNDVPSTSSSKTLCPGCGEDFEDDWILCGKCDQ